MFFDNISNQGLKQLFLISLGSFFCIHANAQMYNMGKDSPVSAMAEKAIDVSEANKNPFSIGFYKPNYLLPLYHTGSPNRSTYLDTPDNQIIQRNEVKGQISFQLPLLENIYNKPLSLHAAYTQLFYWQLYQDSAFFRETNYEPEIFLEYQYSNNFYLDTGVVHQSNGAGGNRERSWNRAYLDFKFSNRHWYASFRPWIGIVKSDWYQIDNKPLSRFLGYEQMLFSYKHNNFVTSLMLRNTIESGFKRSAQEFTVSIPVSERISGFIQIFNGYGQSLIEYDHKTKSIGVGFSLSDWI